MGLCQSSDIMREVAELAPTSSSDVGSNDSDKWISLNTTGIDTNDNSSDEEEDEEGLTERLRILEDSRKLRKTAEFFLHPELPVEVSDATSCARCYFERASAPQQDFDEEEEERARILLDLGQLKKAAYDYLHPEAPVKTSDPTVFGRNYFMRWSAPEPLAKDEEDERELILNEAKALSKLARNVNAPVETDPTAFGRNYFTRPSAPEQTSVEQEEETKLALQDAKALRKLAIYFLHPELPVATNDPTAFGRNYFTRPSAPEQEDDEERQQILADAKALSKLALDYQHPEVPVATTDPTVFGRNYYTRPSAPFLEDEEEMEQIQADANALSKLAADYQHPELPVATDPAAFGRNYFTRPSAPQQEDEEERLAILNDMKALHKVADYFQHPELPVETDPAVFGRSLFGQPSAASISATKSSVNPENEHDLYYHHAHFDMDDDIHLHHVEFDRNTDHHDEITEIRVTTPTATRKVINDFDMMLSMSPGCVMTFAQPK